jgi:hypothetical protein
MNPHLRLILCSVLSFPFACGLLSCAGTGSGYNLGPTHNAAGAVGGLTIEGGVPTGHWFYEEWKNFGTFSANIKSGVTIGVDGDGNQAMTHILTWQGGQVCPQVPFAGQNRVTWTTQQPLKTIKREGNKLYVYVDQNSLPKLSTSYPPGFSLDAYEMLGGAVLGSFRSPLGEVGVSVFEISGKNLILVSAPDRQRRTFVRFELRQ